ncbi:MAG: nuclear transport factor 2 family protein [Blastocatellia bacterium]|nr:nuclear transport factor 2 family protein [Blastocatellia bacterium]
MTDKNQIVGAINNAFETNDIEGVLAHCTDDFTFAMVGHKAASGKDEARAFMSGMGDSEPPKSPPTALSSLKARLSNAGLPLDKSRRVPIQR